MVNRAFYILILILSFQVLQAQSEDPLQTDRPSQTDASSVLPPAVFQVESGFSFNQVNLDKIKLENIYAWGTSWRLGILEGLELRLYTQPTIYESSTGSSESGVGMADLQVGFKLGILKDKDRKTKLALVSHLITPTGTEKLSTGEFGVLAKFAVSHQLGKKHSINYNLGYEHSGLSSGSATYTLTWSVAVFDALNVFIETYGRVPDIENVIASADAGMSYLISPDLQIDYFFGTGLNHEMNFHALGLSLRFNKD